MAYDDNNSFRQTEQESTMSSGPDWNWIGYINSFDDENNNGGGGAGNGCGNRSNPVCSISDSCIQAGP